MPLCSYNHKGMSEKHRDSCAKPGKVPLIGNWQRRASNDPVTIAQWFDKYRTANIGMLTGVAGGIVAIDVDGEYGYERLNDLSGGYIPVTWEFTTPGGGHRYLFLAPEATTLKKFADALPGTDHQEIAFLGDGQQTVVPPSRHMNGGTYEWVEGRSPDDIEIASAPDWMIKKMSLSSAAEDLFDEGDATALPNGKSSETSKASTSRTSSFSPNSYKKGEIVEILRCKCPKVAEAWDLQSGNGCDWHRWFRTTSLLAKSGAVDDALAFSEHSSKHNEDSRTEIENMAKKAFGPTRCTTFGCDTDQIKQCFGKLKMNDKNEITNSPVAFLKAQKSPNTSEVADLVKTYTQYRVQRGALGEISFNKDKEEVFKPFANFVAIPEEEVCLDDGTTQERCFLVTGVLLDDNTKLPSLRVSHQDFHDPAKWVIRWGLRPTIFPGNYNKDKVRHTVQLLSHGVKNTVVYTHLGFRKIGGEWKYLHAGGCSDDDNIQVEVDSRLGRYVLPSKENDPVLAVHRCLSLLEVSSERVTLPLLAMMFLAPLCEILRKLGIEPAFVVWLYGQTGARKSTIAALFLCLFGRFSSKSPPASYKDTANSLERRAFACKDSVLWIDDFHPTQNSLEARKMEQTAQSHIRAYGDRVGRGRMRADATLRQDFPPQGLALDTGEQLPDGHSSNARLLGVELLSEDVNLEKLTEAQRHAPKFAETMLGYTRWLGRLMSDNDFARHLEETFMARRSEAESSRSHGRIAETVSWLRLGLECLLDYAVSIGAVTPDERERRLEKGWKTLLSLADNQSENVRESKPTVQFLGIVSALLQNGSIYTWNVDGSDKEDYEGINRRGIHVGWRDEEHHYYLPDVLYNEVSAFLNRQNEHIPLKKSALWKQLDEEGVITTITETDNGKPKRKRTHRKAIDGNRVNVLWVKKEFVTEEVASEAGHKRREAVEREAAQSQRTPFDEDEDGEAKAG